MSAASGSRARSREIGYAEALADISHLLSAEAARWRNAAEQQIIPHAHAALKVAADELSRLADYAHGAAQVYGMEYAMPIDELLIECLWHPRSGGPPAPAELPWQEQPDS